MISPVTQAKVDISVKNNATVTDAFQFDPDGGVTWSFTGQNFLMEVKGDKDDTTPLLTFSTDAGTIVVDNAITRVIHLLMDDNVLRAALVPGTYVYDFVMYSNDVVPIRVNLMGGKFRVRQGVTGDE